ncbi:MAG: transglutaminaseTgpA domain-containing protein [Actinomycetota bacterium]|nr:transglutaminaseTgpA domain-containing protein [Actinomycetota bacterium]
MARTAGTTARIQRLTALVAIELVALAVGFAFGRVFIGHAATYRLLAVSVASALVAWMFERRSLLLATAVSAVLLVVAIGIIVFPATTWFGAPTLETLHQIGHAAAQVGEEARIQVSPAPANDSLMLAAMTAVWAAVFSCFALAFRAGSPLLSLVPPVALVAFADSVLDGVIKPVYGVLFLIAALAVVFADSLRRIHGWGPVWSPPGARNRLLPSAGRGARRIGAGAVVLAALAPIFVPGFGSKAVIDLSSINADTRVHVSPLVEIGAILNQGDPVEVFQVQSDQPAYWRMVGLDVLDDKGQWSPAFEQGTPVQEGQQLVTGLQGTTITERFTVTNDLGYTWLPIAYEPSALEQADDSVTWFVGSQTLTVAEPPNQGATYSVQSVYPTPSALELETTAVGSAAQYPDETKVPGTIPREIRDLADKWTRRDTTVFDRVISIQRHLTDPTLYRYDQTVRYPSTMQGLADFLTSGKSGFCQQFAGAMAVMLRSLGIPARVAMGYASGALVGDNIYSVTTGELHAWVEVPFEGYGWLPFEPTPGKTNPAMLTYMSSSSTTGCDDPRADCGNSDGTTTPVKKQRPKFGKPQDVNLREGGAGTPLPPTAVEPSRRVSTEVVVGWLALAGLLVLAAIPLVRLFRRRRKLHNAAREPRALILATYDVFSERAADLGFGRSSGETPLEYRRRVEATDLLVDGHLERLTGTVVRAAYASHTPSDDDAMDAAADADQIIRDLRRSTPLRRRLFGIYRRD